MILVLEKACLVLRLDSPSLSLLWDDNLLENYKVGSIGLLRRSILGNDFEDVGSGLVERLFHCILEGQ
jgi:hypothetical protein